LNYLNMFHLITCEIWFYDHISKYGKYNRMNNMKHVLKKCANFDTSGGAITQQQETHYHYSVNYIGVRE